MDFGGPLFYGGLVELDAGLVFICTHYICVHLVLRWTLLRIHGFREFDSLSVASGVQLVFWLEGAVGLEVETASRSHFWLQFNLVSETFLF